MFARAGIYAASQRTTHNAQIFAFAGHNFTESVRVLKDCVLYRSGYLTFVRAHLLPLRASNQGP
jgi:hypothetical protein